MQNFFDKDDSFRLGKILMFLGLFLALYFMMKFVNEVKTFQTIGSLPTQTTIDVAGNGEVTAVPDIATINFNVEASGKTVEVAQNLMNEKMNKAIDFLKTSNIDSKDIQTTNYNAYPEYSNPCGGGMYCPISSNNTPQIIGYKANENVSVKIRAIDTAGKIVDGLGAAGISGISGPSFSVDKIDAVKSDAKQKAIDDAKAKAELLAKQLGVHLGKIVRFTDQGNNPVPMMYSAKAMDAASGGGSPTNIQTGENKYVSDVVITYEIY